MKKYQKLMLVQLVGESRKQVTGLHACLSSQIPQSKEQALVDACCDPYVVPNLSALAKSNVVTVYTQSGQVGHQGNNPDASQLH
jgi:hypothetical protein